MEYTYRCRCDTFVLRRKPKSYRAKLSAASRLGKRVGPPVVGVRLGVAVDRAARHADAAAAKPDRERSLVIRRRWVALLLTILGAVGWYVHASTHTVLLHRPLRDAEHYEGQAGAAELDAGRSAPKSHPTVRWLHLPAECRQWQSRWSSTVRRRDVPLRRLAPGRQAKNPQQSARRPLRAARIRTESMRISWPQVHPASTYTEHTTDGR